MLIINPQYRAFFYLYIIMKYSYFNVKNICDYHLVNMALFLLSIDFLLFIGEGIIYKKEKYHLYYY